MVHAFNILLPADARYVYLNISSAIGHWLMLYRFIINLMANSTGIFVILWENLLFIPFGILVWAIAVIVINPILQTVQRL